MNQPSSPFRQFAASQLWHLRRHVVLALLAMIGLAATELLRPWPLKIVFDYLLLDRPLPAALAFASEWFASKKILTLIVISSGIVLIAGLRGLFAYLESSQTALLGSRIAFELRHRLFAHIQGLPLTYHLHRPTGELMTKIAGDAATIKGFVTDSATTLGAHLLMIVGTFAVMFWMDWKLALMVLASFPLLVWNLWFLHRQARATAEIQRKKEDGMASHINDVLNSVQLVQAFGRERHELRQFENDNREFLDQSLKNARVESTAARAVEITTAIGTCAVVLFGSLQVLHGEMTPGTILVFSSYLHGLYRPIRRMVKVAIRISALQVAVQRISVLLETTPEIVDRPNAISAQRTKGEIAFENVRFRYSSDQSDVLDNLSFRISPGERIAIVGASGAGKSTIIGLMLRLYDPCDGKITLDGVDLRDFQLQSLRSRIGVVLQDSVLRGASVRENILYGNVQATEQEMVAAAQAAHAHEFIMQLENGYDTVIGKRGARLSGGQQRRIAIARALIRHAAILILDEPATGLDRQSKSQMQAGLQTLMQGKTCIVITHDPEAAAGADRVFTLNEGSILEIPTPAAGVANVPPLAENTMVNA